MKVSARMTKYDGDVSWFYSFYVLNAPEQTTADSSPKDDYQADQVGGF